MADPLKRLEAHIRVQMDKRIVDIENWLEELDTASLALKKWRTRTQKKTDKNLGKAIDTLQTLLRKRKGSRGRRGKGKGQIKGGGCLASVPGAASFSSGQHPRDGSRFCGFGT